MLPADAWIDWEAAPRLLSSARLALDAADPQDAWDAAKEAVEIAERGLLPGLEAPWIDARRGELADLRVEALETLAAAGARLGGAAWPAAEQAARAAVQAQPFRESARAALMEVLRARGNVNEALRVYEDIRVLLREELGSSPGAALVALHEQLLRDDPVAAAQARRRTPGTPSSSTLVERDREVALLDTLLREAGEGEGRAVLIEGPPGIGKSRLMAEFRRRAGAGGALVLNARAGELEREFPFGVVRQLFETVVGRPGRARRRRGAPRASCSPRPTTARRRGGDASFAALHGLYWLTLNLAAERPLLLEIDDLHWCDRPSLRFLAYLVRRLEGQPVLVTASVRTGDPPTDAALLAEIANDPATAHVRPGPLSEEAVGALVARRLGAEPDARVPRGLPPHHRRQPAARPPAAQRAGDRRASGPTPHTPTSCARSARAPSRARSCCGSRGCPARRRAVARAVAVLGEGADLPAVAGVSGLDEAQVAGTMAALARAEILRPEPPPGFVHPLVRDAVYHGPAARRARAAARARRRCPAADRAPRWTRSPAS